MLTQVAYPILYVSEMSRSRAYYTEILGFTVEYGSDSFLVLGLGSSRIALNLPPDKSRHAGGQTLVLVSDAIDADFESLRERVQITHDLSDTAYGKTFMFHDPDGNKIEVI